MSKEQTPIEQKLKSIICVELMDLSIMDEVVEHKTDEIYKGVIAIMNVKVLEALEREIKKCVNYYGYDDAEQNVYYETEVKPRYE